MGFLAEHIAAAQPTARIPTSHPASPRFFHVFSTGSASVLEYLSDVTYRSCVTIGPLEVHPFGRWRRCSRAPLSGRGSNRQLCGLMVRCESRIEPSSNGFLPARDNSPREG